MKQLLTIAALAIFAIASSAQAQIVNLGATKLTNRNDGDYITVNRVCGLTSIQMSVQGDGAVIEDLKFVFGNGSVQDVRVRRRFDQGTTSRWIDLDGAKRCVKGIYVYGHSYKRKPRQSLIQFKGRQVNQPQERMFGATMLQNRSDLDVIRFRNPVCGLANVKIKVKRDVAVIEHLLVQFGNGQDQEIRLRKRFAPGSESAWKDLVGQRRCIKQVVIIGHSGNRRPGQTRVEFWGR